MLLDSRISSFLLHDLKPRIVVPSQARIWSCELKVEEPVGRLYSVYAMILLSLCVVVFEFWCCWNDEEDSDGFVVDARNENCCGQICWKRSRFVGFGNLDFENGCVVFSREGTAVKLSYSDELSILELLMCS